MPKYMKAKWGGTCKDPKCGFKFEEGYPIRHYGRGQQYCQKHPDGKGSRNTQASQQTSAPSAIFSPSLAQNIVASYRKGHLDMSRDDAPFVRALRDGMARAEEDTINQSVAEELDTILAEWEQQQANDLRGYGTEDFEGETELDRSLAHGADVAADPRNQ